MERDYFDDLWDLDDDDRNLEDDYIKKKRGQASWRDYFGDDWDPDDDYRSVDDNDRNLDDKEEKKKLKGQARW